MVTAGAGILYAYAKLKKTNDRQALEQIYEGDVDIRN